MREQLRSERDGIAPVLDCTISVVGGVTPVKPIVLLGIPLQVAAAMIDSGSGVVHQWVWRADGKRTGDQAVSGPVWSAGNNNRRMAFGVTR